MIDIAIPIGLPQETAIKDLCRVSGSHLTVVSCSGDLVFASVSPEYFKIYKFPEKLSCEDFSVRIAKRVIRPVICEDSTLRITIDNTVTLRKYHERDLLVTIVSPMEQDFNNTFISEVLELGEQPHDEYDLSAISALRGMVNYAQNGLQVKNGLVYVQGVGFKVYAKMNHPFDFIMTMSNIAELTSFLRAYNNPAAYECNAYAVFKSRGHYFGSRLPVNFIDSEYEQYCSMTPIIETSASLLELSQILQNFTALKNEMTSCTFNLENSFVSVDIGSSYHYDIAIKSDKVSCIFKLPLDILKKMLSNSKLVFTNVQLRVFDSFVAIVTGGISILISRED